MTDSPKAGSDPRLRAVGATVTVTSTIIAGHSATLAAPDRNGSIATGGNNPFGDRTGATITLGPGDRVNPDPLPAPRP